MQHGHGPNESVLPTRFERIYQRKKLSEFDKILSQSWEKTTTVSHAAQRSSSMGDDTEFLLTHRKNASTSNSADKDDIKKEMKADERSDSMNSIFSRNDT